MKIDSQLERNSFLIWKYYANDGVPFQQSMKFYENIKVSERGKTRYSTQSPIGRNSSVFVYMGTESRSFRVQFNLTLPHILEHSYIEPSDTFFGRLAAKAKAKADYFTYLGSGTRFTGGSPGNGKDAGALIEYFDRRYSSYLSQQEIFELIKKVLEGGAIPSTAETPRKSAVKTLINFLCMIRSSTLTHQKQPHYGPPVIRLNHGIGVGNIPCICDGYTIDFDGDAGYDQKTLLPNVIKVSMDLKEVRITPKGQGSFNAVGPEGGSGDFEAGWDSSISFLSTNSVRMGNPWSESKK